MMFASTEKPRMRMDLAAARKRTSRPAWSATTTGSMNWFACGAHTNRMGPSVGTLCCPRAPVSRKKEDMTADMKAMKRSCTPFTWDVSNTTVSANATPAMKGTEQPASLSTVATQSMPNMCASSAP